MPADPSRLASLSADQRAAVTLTPEHALILAGAGSGKLSGIDFLDAVRARAQDDIPGALLTGDTSSQFIEQVAASRWPILFKPVHPRELQAVLKLLRATA